MIDSEALLLSRCSLRSVAEMYPLVFLWEYPLDMFHHVPTVPGSDLILWFSVFRPSFSGTKDVPSVRSVIDTTFQLIDSPKLSHQRQQSNVSYQNV